MTAPVAARRPTISLHAIARGEIAVVTLISGFVHQMYRYPVRMASQGTLFLRTHEVEHAFWQDGQVVDVLPSATVFLEVRRGQLVQLNCVLTNLPAEFDVSKVTVSCFAFFTVTVGLPYRWSNAATVAG